MSNTDTLIANDAYVLREEYDDWAILFNPDTSESFGLNPVSVSIFKRLNGEFTMEDIISDLRAEFNNAPEDADQLVHEFVRDLINRGIAKQMRDN